MLIYLKTVNIILYQSAQCITFKIVQITPPKTQGELYKREQNDCQSQHSGRMKAKLSSGHDEAIPCMNTQHLCVVCRRSVQDRLGQYSDMGRRRDNDPPPIQLWIVGGFQGKIKTGLLKNVDTCSFTILQWKVSYTHGYIGSITESLKKSTWSWEWVRPCRADQGGEADRIKSRCVISSNNR